MLRRLALAGLVMAVGPALAQQTNANNPPAPAPAKAAPLETGGKPQTQSEQGGMKGAPAKMSKKARHKHHHH